MIHVTQEMTQISGTKMDLSVEVTALLRHCFNGHIFTKEDMQEFVRLASMTNEELRAENKRLDEELRKKLNDMNMPDELKDMLKLFGELL